MYCFDYIKLTYFLTLLAVYKKNEGQTVGIGLAPYSWRIGNPPYLVAWKEPVRSSGALVSPAADWVTVALTEYVPTCSG